MTVIEPFSPRRRRRSRTRVGLWVSAGALAACAAALGLAVLAWPQARLEADSTALARVSLPGFAGTSTRVEVRGADGARIPVRLTAGRLWPLRSIPVGESLRIELTVRHPSWAGWLVGRTETRRVELRTPDAVLRSQSSEVHPGEPVTISFSMPVRRVRIRVGDRVRRLRFADARSSVTVGVVAHGLPRAGTFMVSAAPRTWERLPRPVPASWFPVRPDVQVLVDPAPRRQVGPRRQLTLTFSRPVAQVLGSRQPTITPAVPGRWRAVDTHTLAFRPVGLGYPLGTDLLLTLPTKTTLALSASARPTRSLSWHVAAGSTLRLQQLLARAGYLPLDWAPSADAGTRGTRVELASAVDPPEGHFSWRYANTPPELRALWRAGKANEITRAAVMRFEDTHGLAVDGFAGPKVWHALLVDALAGRRHEGGYSYVYVHRAVPQSLTLWHNGRAILSSPGNTGVPAAPTQLGTFPVFEHIPVGTMSGTNPDGTHYHDPGIRYISYFNHGDAIHAFNRSSFGTPQSLGCVELPLAAAAKVWPYTPIGTLVTIEN